MDCKKKMKLSKRRDDIEPNFIERKDEVLEESEQREELVEIDGGAK